MKTVTLGIKSKLIVIFLVIKIFPLVVMAWFAWGAVYDLIEVVQGHFREATRASREVTGMVGRLAVDNSITALDRKARESIERLTTDTARNVARFLYQRDRDIDYAASLVPSEEAFAGFLATRKSPITTHPEYFMDPAGKKWITASGGREEGITVQAGNRDNEKDFHSRPPDRQASIASRPLYLEMSFVDLQGKEKVKVSTSSRLPSKLLDISKRENTYCRAETYFEDLHNLKPGEIYVSEVIGPYQPTHLIGPYTRERAERLQVEFKPEESGYAGSENPVGRRFKGLVRWVKPVVSNGKKIGYVTLALDHDHLMEFTDYIVPTKRRYTAISNASTGNYAFMWDYKGRNISHPRDYFIVGYDPTTGEPVAPWMDEELYGQWKGSGAPLTEFLETVVPYREQSLDRLPSQEQISRGTVGLDCRYLNFAPQCDGWRNLTRYGGSGSFLIFWSGLWKLTTAASIPYYTGRYAESPRGFGYVTIGANVDEFHRAAVTTAEQIAAIEKRYLRSLESQNRDNQEFLKGSLGKTTRDLTLYTAVMVVVVICIAIWMASSLTGRLMQIVGGMQIFRQGDLGYRLKIESGDEIEDLAKTFNTMADTIEQSMTNLQSAKIDSDKTNERLTREIQERKKAEAELASHKENLQETVEQRTKELVHEMRERKQAEESKMALELRLKQAEKMEAIGTLAGGVAHDLNNILSGLVSYPDLLLLDVKKDEPSYEALLTIKKSGEKAAAIVQDLLTLARRGVRNPEVVRINELIEEYLQSPEYLRLISEYPGVELELGVEKKLLPVYGSVIHLFKVVMNLIANGIEAMTDGGLLTVTTENRYLDQPLKLYEEVEQGEYVVFSVADRGSGIKPEDADRVFEPFFSTKKPGSRSGTGLGMAVVWGVVKEHNGYIDFRSREGGGTRFSVYFPAYRGEEFIAESTAETEICYGNGERVLIVDDIEEQLEIGSKILAQLGYRPLTASSGEEALEYLRNNRVDLVVLDMIMEPGKNGLETYREILKIHPDQKTIIASGYAETDDVKTALALGVAHYLQKPYTVANLGRCIKSGLELKADKVRQ